MRIKIVNESNWPMPAYANPGDAGCDLRANIEYSKVMLPMTGAIFPTGIHIELPYGYEGAICGRSGLNFKHDIICPKSTVDAPYRGEIKVKLYNLGSEQFIVNPGDRIAQLIINPVIKAEWEDVDELSESERGIKGFGSSGIL